MPADRDIATSVDVSRPPDRADVVEEKLTVPVLLAALASVPATFLTMLEGTAADVGVVVNWVSLAVLTAESAVLLVLSGDKIRWLREHWFIVAVAVVAIPAVVFAIGPVQLLRLVRFVGALRIIRARRIIKAGRILQRRANLEGPIRNAVVALIMLLCAVFVAIVLADPTSEARQFIEAGLERYGIPGVLAVVVAGGMLGGATFVAWRYRRNGKGADEQEERETDHTRAG